MLAFTITSAVADIRTAVRTVTISGVPIGLITAIVLLGPGPAALVGAVTMVAFRTQRRTPWYVFLNNVATFMWYPMVAGLFFRETVHLGHIGQDAIAYYLVVFPTFVIALIVNFIGVIGFHCYLDRTPLAEAARLVVIPILSAELFSALLTMGAAYVAVSRHRHRPHCLALLVFQYLIGELLKSKQRGEELRRMATTDELTGLPNREVFRASSTIASPRLRPAMRASG